ncbi:MAG: hypothetical protein ACRCYR_06870, partial [Phycicoccus sp.]
MSVPDAVSAPDSGNTDDVDGISTTGSDGTVDPLVPVWRSVTSIGVVPEPSVVDDAEGEPPVTCGARWSSPMSPDLSSVSAASSRPDRADTSGAAGDTSARLDSPDGADPSSSSPASADVVVDCESLASCCDMPVVPSGSGETSDDDVSPTPVDTR